jgi:lysyl-tRNA synthetase class I
MINNISTTTLACIMPMGIELLKNTYEVIQTLSENEQNETTKNKLNNLAEQQRIHINKFSEHQQIFQQYQEKILLLMEKQTASLIEAFDSLTNINE